MNHCPHFGLCAGCSENLSLKPPPVWEEVLSFFAPDITAHLHQGSPLHWRHRAKVAVRGSSLQPLIGLFKRHSHDVLPIPFCFVHHPHLNQAFEIIRSWFIQNGFSPYDEKTGKGEIRYLQGVVQRTSGLVQLTFVLNMAPDDPRTPIWQTLIHQLGEKHSHFWHSLWINFNQRSTNTIFGEHWSHIWGEEYLWEQFGNISACYGPASFGQANLNLFERLLFRLRELLPEEACVTEFYAGVGVIGLFIASHCQWVQCSEINPHAEGYFKQAQSRLPSSLASRLNFTSGATHQTISLLKGASSAIVDPPRKGLDPQFFSAIKETPTLQQLLYISCGWEAFQRDCKKLCAEGWKIQNVDGYLFFPGSNHVELLVNFCKNGNA